MRNQSMITMWSYLPEELVEKILVRVAIKPLLRMRLVCKRWKNLIVSSHFIYAHLNFTKLIQNSSLYLIVYPPKYDQNAKVDLKSYYVVYHEGKDGFLEKSQTFEFPADEFVIEWSIISCCNGVVCLPVSLTLDPERKVLFLWNPMIGRFLRLPKSNVVREFWRFNHPFGFVFDRVTNDYKVLRIYPSSCNKTTSLVEIFRLSNGLWEVITASPLDHVSSISAQVGFEGIAHWIGKGNGERKIVTFDTHEEVFGGIGLPLPINERQSYEFVKETYHLFVFEKSLFLVEHVGTYMNYGRCCLWRMNEYGVVESWTRLCTFVSEMLMRPLGFRMNGEMLWFVESGTLFSTNLEDGLPNYCSAFEAATWVSSSSCYVESLVLLDHPMSKSSPVSTLKESIIL